MSHQNWYKSWPLFNFFPKFYKWMSSYWKKNENKKTSIFHFGKIRNLPPNSFGCLCHMILYHIKLKWFLESDSQMSKGILERTNASVSIICISGIIWTIEVDYMTFYRIRPIKANRETRKITWSKGQKCWKCQNNFAWVQFICRNVLYRKTFQFQKLFCTKVTHLKINHVIECKEISQLNIGFMPKNIDGFQNSRYVSTVLFISPANSSETC